MTDPKLEAFLNTLSTTETIKDLYRQHGLSYGWIVMITISMATVATQITGTIINVAIPEIMGTYGVGQDKGQWLSTAFLAAATITMVMSSWGTHNFGARTLMLASMSLYILGSILGGISPNLEVMIFARILQGASAGVITPMIMSIIFLLFPFTMQGKVMGISMLAVVLAPAVGPAVGGILIDTLSWRYVYFVGLPMAFLALPIAAFYLPPKEPDGPRPPLDWPGLILISICVSTLLIALSDGERKGWDSNYITSLMGITITSFSGFIYRELHCDHPLLDLKVFSYYRFAVMSVFAACFGAGMFGSFYIVPLFLQISQHMTPTDAGVIAIPGGLIMAVVFPLSGRIADRYDHRLLFTFGIIVFAYSCWLMVSADINTSFWTFCWWIILSRIGMGLVAPSLNLSAMQALPMEHLQQGAGAINFVRQLGGAFGVNLLSLALTRRIQFHRDSVFATQSFDHSGSQAALVDIQHSLAPAGLSAIEAQYVSYRTLGQMIYHEAEIFAFQDGFLALGIMLALSLIPIWMLRKKHLVVVSR